MCTPGPVCAQQPNKLSKCYYVCEGDDTPPQKRVQQRGIHTCTSIYILVLQLFTYLEHTKMICALIVRVFSGPKLAAHRDLSHSPAINLAALFVIYPIVLIYRLGASIPIVTMKFVLLSQIATYVSRKPDHMRVVLIVSALSRGMTF